MQRPTMRTEPLRLPAWLVSAYVLVLAPLASDLLLGGDWRKGLAAALVAVGPILAGTEAVRSFVDSPATKAAKAAAVAQVVATQPIVAAVPAPPMGAAGSASIPGSGITATDPAGPQT